MEIYNPTHKEYISRVKVGREELFRGIVWRDLNLMNDGLSRLNRCFGNDQMLIQKAFMNIMDELEEDYWWFPDNRSQIIPEA